MLRMKLELLVKSIVKARYGTSKNPFFFFVNGIIISRKDDIM